MIGPPAILPAPKSPPRGEERFSMRSAGKGPSPPYRSRRAASAARVRLHRKLRIGCRCERNTAKRRFRAQFPAGRANPRSAALSSRTGASRGAAIGAERVRARRPTARYPSASATALTASFPAGPRERRAATQPRSPRSCRPVRTRAPRRRRSSLAFVRARNTDER